MTHLHPAKPLIATPTPDSIHEFASDASASHIFPNKTIVKLHNLSGFENRRVFQYLRLTVSHDLTADMGNNHIGVFTGDIAFDKLSKGYFSAYSSAENRIKLLMKIHQLLPKLNNLRNILLSGFQH